MRGLVEGTEAVAREQYDHVVDVRTRDELRTLADSFNGMLRGLRERFAMLKFVPRHARAAIAQSVVSRTSGILSIQVAHRRDVAVLFSDIRGFTKISDRLPPDRVIEMLNIFLRREAEIIESHGGSVDKFIGDGVMAVFEGEHRFADAARTALAIHAAFAELNQQGVFEQTIAVGIGIGGGDVVVGGLGTEERLELAVIGRNVNLASRLCGHAGPSEVLVSDEVWQRLEGGFAAERLDGVRLKGFADEVTCWKLKGPSTATAAQ